MVDKSGYSILAAFNTLNRPWWHRFMEPFFTKCFGVEGKGTVSPSGKWRGYIFNGKTYMIDWVSDE